ncbi:hypothetical protein [Streptomyces roseicoloratus]|uniref:Lipoprotein n=1 Tax=Streptomyces roseicoloratus TaxID=2508722 RepID=A0ABY9RRF2_9ACTN|nr:hypothetical protein [Streptomyces roseicoloratus]WMX44756.1 hypothetical protein RGF97_07675 [Streptomyces roseicoloratus]
MAGMTAAVLTLAGCGAGDPLVEDANEQLRSTSFHSSGTTTAFSGGTQEAWWDPKQGYHVKASWIGGSGEMFCKDGRTYTGVTLLANALKEKGQPVTVPERLAGEFVVTETEGGCETFFEIPEEAERAAGNDRTLHGRKAQAFTISAAGGARDTYYVDGESSRLLLLESARGGRSSTTEYDDYGELFPFSMPQDGNTMSMEEFRRQVTPG